MKKAISWILTIALLFSLMPTGIFTLTAEAATVASGTCGDNLTWTLDDTGTLTISGTGAMTDFGAFDIPWYNYCDSVKMVIIGNSVTSIGDWAFSNCKNMTSVTIGSSVTKIGDLAFSKCTGLTSVMIPSLVSSIGKQAFEGCSSLTTVNIPVSVTNIGVDAFYTCGNLIAFDVDTNNPAYSSDAYGVLFNKDKSSLILCPNGKTGIYTIPNSVMDIGANAFKGCAKLTGVEIPDSVKTIAYFAFGWCENLASIDIPDSVTSLGMYAFYKCYGLTSAKIGVSVTDMGDYTFEGCSELAEITFYGDAPSFGSYAFSGVTATAYYPADNNTWTADVMKNYGGTITWVAMEAEPEIVASGTCGDNLTWTLDTEGTLTISGTGDMADYDWNRAPWYDLREAVNMAVIANGVTSIGEQAFYSCASLTSIAIPNGVTYIGDYAFAHCDGLTSIAIPTDVTHIGDSAFMSCSSLGGIWVDEGNTNYGSDERGVLFNKDKTKLIQAPGALTGSYTIPDSVTTIAAYAFYKCAALTSVTIPDSVINIGSSAFSGCAALTSVAIGNSVDYVGFDAFSFCTSLASVTISDGVGGISHYAFSNCTALTSVIIPESVDFIGAEAFSDCTNLKEISFEGSAPDIDSSAFTEVTATAYYYPDETWTADLMQNYGGTITWVAMGRDTERATLSGSYISFGEAVNAVTIQLIPSGETEAAYAFVSDGTASTGLWSIEDVLPGSYTVQVVKKNHVTREYTLTVGESDTELDLEIWLLGDVTGDGLVNFSDYSKVLNQSKNPSGGDLSGYAWQCGNVTGDSIINFSDYSQVLAQAKGSGSLWED